MVFSLGRLVELGRKSVSSVAPSFPACSGTTSSPPQVFELSIPFIFQSFLKSINLNLNPSPNFPNLQEFISLLFCPSSHPRMPSSESYCPFSSIKHQCVFTAESFNVETRRARGHQHAVDSRMAEGKQGYFRSP